MELYKILEGRLMQAPENIEWVENYITHCETPATESTLLSLGWKPLIKAEIIQPLEWYKKAVLSYNETESNIVESYVVVASDTLRGDYLNMILVELNRALENDFTWGGHIVKMTESNQKDYLASAFVATRRPEMYIPMEYTFKDNVKHLMETLEELENFTNLGLQFVSSCLETYRSEKDNVASMSDSQLYDYVKTL